MQWLCTIYIYISKRRKEYKSRKKQNIESVSLRSLLPLHLVYIKLPQTQAPFIAERSQWVSECVRAHTRPASQHYWIGIVLTALTPSNVSAHSNTSLSEWAGREATAPCLSRAEVCCRATSHNVQFKSFRTVTVHFVRASPPFPDLNRGPVNASTQTYQMLTMLLSFFSTWLENQWKTLTHLTKRPFSACNTIHILWWKN